MKNKITAIFEVDGNVHVVTIFREDDGELNMEVNPPNVSPKVQSLIDDLWVGNASHIV